MRSFIPLALAVLAGCYGGFDDRVFAPDASAVDAGEADAGEVDAGEVDAGDVDAGDVDAGDVDAGDVDAGEVDAGTFVTRITGNFGGPVDVELAWIALVGQRGSSVVPTASGVFALEGLPEGPCAIAASDGVSRAALLRLPGAADRSSTATLVLEAGATLSGHVRWADGTPARGVGVRLADLPGSTRTDPDGAWTLAALPAGCVSIAVERAGVEASREACLEAGGVQVVDFTLGAAPAPGSSGACEACGSDADCAGGATCVVRRFGQARESVCAVGCQRPQECGSDEVCDPVESGGKACVPSRRSCAALDDAASGRMCELRANCGLGGASGDGARCAAGRCTVSCSAGQACPAGATCSADSVCE